MKVKKVFMFGMLLLGISVLVSCKKKATQDELKDQKPESTTFQLTYGLGITSQSFTGIQGFSNGDVLLVYGKSTIDGETS